MFIKDGTYRSVDVSGLTAPILEGTVLTSAGAVAAADGSDAFGIVPETVFVMPPTKMVNVVIGGTIDLQDPANANVTISKAVQDALSADINFIPGAGALPPVDSDDDGKFLVVENGKWKAGGHEAIVDAVSDWLDDHPEATTTVEDGAVTTAKLAAGAVTDAKLAQNGGVLSEVHDIRVGADGTIYNTAGDAVRSQGNELAAVKNDIENNLAVVNNPSITFVQGTISTQGVNNSSQTRCRSQCYILLNPVIGNIYLQIAVGYKMSLRKYSDDAGTFVGTTDWMTGSVTLKTNAAYYYRFVIAKTDDARITPSDIPSDALIITSYESNTDEIEKLTYEIFGEDGAYGTSTYGYIGERIKLKTPNHTFNRRKIVDIGEIYTPSSVTSIIAQGMAIYDQYAFGLLKNGECIVLDLETKTVVGEFLFPNRESSNHVNSADFSNVFYDETDSFPLLYVSQCNGSNNSACYVYRVTLNGATLIQTITYDNGNGDYTGSFDWIVDCDLVRNAQYKKLWIWGNGANNKHPIKTFPLPDITESIVEYTDADVEKEFLLETYLPASEKINVYQGHTIWGNYLFLVDGQWQNNKIYCFNRYTMAFIGRLGSSTLMPYEFEDVAVYDGELIIYQLSPNGYGQYYAVDFTS